MFDCMIDMFERIPNSNEYPFKRITNSNAWPIWECVFKCEYIFLSQWCNVYLFILTGNVKYYNLLNRSSTLYTTLEPPPLSASTDTRTSQFSAIYLLFQADHTVGKMYLYIPLDSLNFPFVQRCKQFHLVIKKIKVFWTFIITISCLKVRVLHCFGRLNYP